MLACDGALTGYRADMIADACAVVDVLQPYIDALPWENSLTHCAACRGPVQDVAMMSAQPVVAAAGKKGRGKRLRLLSSSEESSSEHEGEESPTAPGLPRQESLGTKLKSLRQAMY